jgi:hypothetical protein
LTLSVARAELRAVEAGRRNIGDRLGGILLDGYNFSREITAGKTGTVLVISTNSGGGILLFRPDQSYAASKAVGEPTSIQVFDLDDDGLPELVLDEINGRGTGVLNENYHLYGLQTSNIRELWSGESFVLEWPDSSRVPEKRNIGFLNFRPSAFGEPSRMVHFAFDEVTGKESRRTYTLRSGRVAVVSTETMVMRPRS